ncbi:MAG: hypothetical protein HDT02_03205 [Bacteroidales bacterium]|nr:hypothetical protein [Bacteroidales bacterium]
MMNNERCGLKLIGITYNQIESGVYAVILEGIEMQRRLPIVIGYPEAQSIECVLQNVKPPRPLTHDLMIEMLDRFGIHLREVNIFRLESGVFAAELLLEGPDGDIKTLDSRSSDGIALAIRCGAPIYTTWKVLEESGFEPDKKAGTQQESPRRGAGRKSGGKSSSTSAREADLKGKSRDKLIKEMEMAAEREDYETAARIKEELRRRDAETTD